MKTIFFWRMAFIAGIMLMAASCGNENDEIKNTIKPPASAEFNKVRDDALKSITQTKTFKAEDGIDFTSTGGVHLFINPNTMYINGTRVTGNVTLDFVELYKRGNMLVVNKPLMGTAMDGLTKGPMITGGQFYINVTKDGRQVDPFYSHMTVPDANTGEHNPDMTLWKGTENEDGNMVWEEVGLKDEQGGVFAGDACYDVWGRLFNWINIDILYSLPDPKTQVWVKVPDGYDNKNCSVYVVYKDKPGALAYLDVWDPNKKMFTEHYGLAPIGFNFYVIFISTQNDGKLIYAYKNVTIEKDKIIIFEANELKVLDIDALVTLINNLPK